MCTTKVKCGECGWWDIGMKYGHQVRCTQCGAVIAPQNNESSLQPVLAVALAAK